MRVTRSQTRAVFALFPPELRAELLLHVWPRRPDLVACLCGAPATQEHGRREFAYLCLRAFQHRARIPRRYVCDAGLGACVHGVGVFVTPEAPHSVCTALQCAAVYGFWCTGSAYLHAVHGRDACYRIAAGTRTDEVRLVPQHVAGATLAAYARGACAWDDVRATEKSTLRTFVAGRQVIVFRKQWRAYLVCRCDERDMCVHTGCASRAYEMREHTRITPVETRGIDLIPIDITQILQFILASSEANLARICAWSPTFDPARAQDVLQLLTVADGGPSPAADATRAWIKDVSITIAIRDCFRGHEWEELYGRAMAMPPLEQGHAFGWGTVEF